MSEQNPSSPQQPPEPQYPQQAAVPPQPGEYPQPGFSQDGSQQDTQQPGYPSTAPPQPGYPQSYPPPPPSFPQPNYPQGGYPQGYPQNYPQAGPSGQSYAPGYPQPPQPPYPPGYPQQGYYPQGYSPYGYPLSPGEQTNFWAILAIIFGFVFPPLGIAWGVRALLRIGRTGEKGRGLALTGIIVGAVEILFLVGVIVAVSLSGSSSGSDAQSYAAPPDYPSSAPSSPAPSHSSAPVAPGASRAVTSATITDPILGNSYQATNMVTNFPNDQGVTIVLVKVTMHVGSLAATNYVGAQCEDLAIVAAGDKDPDDVSFDVTALLEDQMDAAGYPAFPDDGISTGTQSGWCAFPLDYGWSATSLDLVYQRSSQTLFSGNNDEQDVPAANFVSPMTVGSATSAPSSTSSSAALPPNS